MIVYMLGALISWLILGVTYYLNGRALTRSGPSSVDRHGLLACVVAIISSVSLSVCLLVLCILYSKSLIISIEGKSPNLAVKEAFIIFAMFSVFMHLFVYQFGGSVRYFCGSKWASYIDYPYYLFGSLMVFFAVSYAVNDKPVELSTIQYEIIGVFVLLNLKILKASVSIFPATFSSDTDLLRAPPFGVFISRS